MDVHTYGRDGWTDVRTAGWTDGRTDGWRMEGRDRRTDGWKDERTERQTDALTERRRARTIGTIPPHYCASKSIEVKIPFEF